MLRLDPESISAITEYMFVPDDVLDADATIVLGMSLWHRPLQKAMELHQDGVAGRLVFSGGYNPKISAVESLAMKTLWIERGFPEQCLLIDAHAGNTRENMENSRGLLLRHGMLRHGMSINIISISYHMRRAAETFREVFGPGVNLGIANYPSMHCDPHAWFANCQGRDLVLGEAMKIQKYFPDRAARLDELLGGGSGCSPECAARLMERNG